jgi:hypothetical protein
MLQVVSVRAGHAAYDTGPSAQIQFESRFVLSSVWKGLWWSIPVPGFLQSLSYIHYLIINCELNLQEGLTEICWIIIIRVIATKSVNSLEVKKQSICIYKDSIHIVMLNVKAIIIITHHSWSWALLEKLPIVQLLENFPAFYGTQRSITAFT